MHEEVARYAHVTYCDDVRLEVGSKFSLMGIYNGLMAVPQFPFVLGKLVAFVSIAVPADQGLSAIKVECSIGDNILASLDISVDEVSRFTADWRKAWDPLLNGEPRRGNLCQLQLVMGGLNLTEECTLYTKVLIGDDLIASPRLRIVSSDKFPPQTPA